MLVAALLVVAFTGATAGSWFSSQGLHSPHNEYRVGVHRVGVVQTAHGRRLAFACGPAGVGATVRTLPYSVAGAPALSRAPLGWQKLASGLVPLPLRI